MLCILWLSRERTQAFDSQTSSNQRNHQSVICPSQLISSKLGNLGHFQPHQKCKPQTTDESIPIKIVAGAPINEVPDSKIIFDSVWKKLGKKKK